MSVATLSKRYTVGRKSGHIEILFAWVDRYYLGLHFCPIWLILAIPTTSTSDTSFWENFTCSRLLSSLTHMMSRKISSTLPVLTIMHAFCKISTNKQEFKVSDRVSSWIVGASSWFGPWGLNPGDGANYLKGEGRGTNTLHHSRIGPYLWHHTGKHAPWSAP